MCRIRRPSLRCQRQTHIDRASLITKNLFNTLSLYMIQSYLIKSGPSFSFSIKKTNIYRLNEPFNKIFTFDELKFNRTNTDCHGRLVMRYINTRSVEITS